MSIYFDKINHKYFIDSKPAPGVNEIISDIWHFDMAHMPEERLERAMELGTKVHKATELHDTGLLENNEDDSVLGYLTAYRRFLGDLKAIPVLVEKVFSGCDQDNQESVYCGTVDRIMDIGGERWCIDLKTGGVYPRTRLQTAGYFLAYNQDNKGFCATKRGALYLKHNGEYGFKEHTNDYDYECFLSALRLFYFKHPRYRSKVVEIWD